MLASAHEAAYPVRGHIYAGGPMRGLEVLEVHAGGVARPSPILDPRQADGGVRGSELPPLVHETASRWRREGKTCAAVRPLVYFFRCAFLFFYRAAR